jgi:hypothetical protein
MVEDPFTKAARDAEEMAIARAVADADNNLAANDKFLRDKSISRRIKNAFLKLMGYAGFEGEDDDINEEE